MIANLSNLLHPFMPKTSAKLKEFLGLENKFEWKEVCPKAEIALAVTPLFERIV